MDEFVPTTTDHVRGTYAYGRVDLDYTTSGEANDEFDRWLAAHDRRVRAEALRDAAEEFPRDGHVAAIDGTGRVYPYGRLHDLADMIERGDQ